MSTIAVAKPQRPSFMRSDSTQHKSLALVQSLLRGEKISPKEKKLVNQDFLNKVRQRNHRPPSIQRTGGPDAFGYLFADSQEPNGPAFSWIERSDNSTIVPLTSFTDVEDGYCGPVNLPFQFPFYGVGYDSMYLGSNGYISFNSGYSGIPSSTLPIDYLGAMICFWGSDLNLGYGGTTVWYQTLTNPNRLVITYDSVAISYSPFERLSAQVVLSGNGSIVIQYRNISNSAWVSAIGLQNSERSSYISYSPPAPQSNTAVEFYTPCSLVVNYLPVNNAFQVPVTTNLSWRPGECTNSYDVYFSSNRNDVLSMSPIARVATNTSETSWTPSGNLLSGTRYYWRIFSRSATDSNANAMNTFRTFSPALSGTQTIGGNNPNFATIHDAINTLNLIGTSNGVTFLIRGGDYDEPPDSISASSNSGVNARVVFKPADTMGVFIHKTSHNNDMYGFELVGASYITFDGSQPDAPGRNFISLDSPDGSCEIGFYITGGSNYCSIKNVNITFPINYPYEQIYSVSEYETNYQPCNYDTVKNCFLSGGADALTIDSYSMEFIGWVVSGNRIADFSENGITFNVSNGLVSKNIITSNNVSNNYECMGINGSYCVNSVIDGNWIYGMNGSASGNYVCGIRLYGDGANIISNNMINLDQAYNSGLLGISIGYSGGNVINNTVRIGGTSNYNSPSYALDIEGIVDTVANNILMNVRDGYNSNSSSYCLLAYPQTPFTYSDHNVISTGDESTNDFRYVAMYNYTNYNSLSDLRNVPGYIWDVHSYSLPASFSAIPDLHISTTSPTIVEGHGQPFASVPYDFDGQTRSTVSPDIGCDEGNFTTATDLENPVISMSPLGNWFQASSRVVSATITDNIGVANGTNAPRIYFKRTDESTWSWHSVDSIGTNNTFYFTISAYPLNSVIQYYVAAQDTSRNVVTYPYGGSGTNPPGTTPPFTLNRYYVALPLNGIKTIGGINPDYPTIHAAINALNHIGTTTGVTFMIRGGTYTEPGDSIFSSAGGSASNRIIFRPEDTSGVVINKTFPTNTNYSRTGYYLWNTDYITFDGSVPGYPGRRFLTLTSSDSTCDYGFYFGNGCDYCCVKNLNINGLSRISYTSSIAVYSVSNSSQQPPTLCNYDSVLNCSISGTQYGIELDSPESGLVSAGWTIANNELFDFQYTAISVTSSNEIAISHNKIYRRTPLSTTIYSSVNGIMLQNVNGGIVDGNWIYGLESNANDIYGISISSYLITNPTSIVISNNMIDFESNATNGVYGLSLGEDNLMVTYNTVHLGGVTPNSGYSYALILNGSSQNTITNNILINERSSTLANANQFCIGSNYSNTTFISDYNIISTIDDSPNDNRYVARLYNPTLGGWLNYNTLADLRSQPGYTGDAHSLDVAPIFVAEPDLHISSLSPTPVEGNAQPNAAVTTDIDGNPRNATTPDIGCDEGNFLTGDFYVPTITFTPLGNYDQTTTRVFSAVIRDNIGVASGLNAPRVYYKRTVDTTWSWRVADSLHNDSVYSFSIPGQALNTIVQYYLAAQDTSGNLRTFPYGAYGTNPPGFQPTQHPLIYYVSLPINGTRTIGGTNPDYPTIHDAIVSLNAIGTTTGVTFLIRGGVYNEPIDTIFTSCGSGPNSRVIFRPADSNNVTIYKHFAIHNSNQSHSGFTFANCDYITFDGCPANNLTRRFMNISSPDTTCDVLFTLSNGSDYDCVKNLNISLPVLTSGTAINCEYDDGVFPLTAANSDSVLNCGITGGANGLTVSSTISTTIVNGWVIANNQITDCGENGIAISYCDLFTIKHNTISQTGIGYSNYYGRVGIYLTNETNSIVDGNRIFGLSSYYGGSIIGIELNSYNSLGSSIVSNNMIDLVSVSQSQIVGIDISAPSVSVVYNSVHVGGIYTGTSGSYYMYLSSALALDYNASNTTIQNNILINERTGGPQQAVHLCFYEESGEVNASDYNIISTVDDSPYDNTYVTLYYNSALSQYTPYNTLSDLRASGNYPYDVHSFEIAPIFVAANDLHINPSRPSPVEGNGHIFTAVTTDYDGTVRSSVTPDIGCDEGNFTSGDFYHPIIHFTPLNLWQQTTPRTFLATIIDNIGVAQGANSPRVYYKRYRDTLWSWCAADSVRLDSLYYFTLPGYPMNTRILYYIAAQDTSQNMYSYPRGARGSNPPGNSPTMYPASYYVANPLAGVRTIGGTNADYGSLREAAEALNLIDVAEGGVIIRFRNGNYFDSTVTIRSQYDALHPVTFGVDSGATVTLTLSSATQDGGGIVLHSSNITFDGSWPRDSVRNHLNLVSNRLYRTIWLSDSASHNTIKNCIIDNHTTAEYYYGAIHIEHQNTTQPSQIVGNRVLNCEIIGGLFGLYENGNDLQSIDSTEVSNCVIRNFYSYGASFNYGTGVLFNHNRLYTSTQTSSILTGVTCSYTFGSKFDANWIGPFATSYSAYGLNLYANNSIFSNNMVTLGSNSNGYLYGMYIVANNNTGNKYLFNTISIQGNSSNYDSYAFVYESAWWNVAGYDTITGNIFQNTRTGGATQNAIHGAVLYDSNFVAYCDYNLLSVGNDTPTDNRYIATVFNSNSGITSHFNSLVDLQASRWSPHDSLSFTELAPFISDSNLHIRSNISTGIEGGAQHIWSVPTDFDGDIRNSPTCDVGCDEGNFQRLAYGTITGVVRDSIPGFLPMSGVLVRAGRYSDTTDTSGRYSLDVRTGNYNVIFSKTCYALDSTSVVVDSLVTDTVNVAMLHPEFHSDQSSIEIVSSPGETHSTTLVIQNTGNAPLHWRGRAVGQAHGFDRHRGKIIPKPVIEDGQHSTDIVKVKGKPVGGKIDGRVVAKNAIPEVQPTLQISPKLGKNVSPKSVTSIDQMWGPDSAGYTAVDSDDPGFPQNISYLEIRDIGTHVIGPQDPGILTPMDGFSFSYYGVEHSSIWVTSYGYVQFVGIGSNTENNTQLPNFGIYNGIFVLHAPIQTTVFKYYDSAADIFYIEWVGTDDYSLNDSLIFQLQLYGSNQALVFSYNRVATQYLQGTIGIQGFHGDASRSIQCYYTPTYPFPRDLNDYSIAYTNLFNGGGWVNWLTMSPNEGTVLPHQVAEISVSTTVSDSVTVPSTLSGNLMFLSDACPVSVTVPISVSVVESVPENALLPKQYKLHQNFPNPFNPTTEIRFDLKEPGKTRLVIYNSVGQQVTELVNRDMPAGYHSVRFNATRLATGIYFYRLESGQFTSVKKMVLVK